MEKSKPIKIGKPKIHQNRNISVPYEFHINGEVVRGTFTFPGNWTKEQIKEHISEQYKKTKSQPKPDLAGLEGEYDEPEK